MQQPPRLLNCGKAGVICVLLWTFRDWQLESREFVVMDTSFVGGEPGGGGTRPCNVAADGQLEQSMELLAWGLTVLCVAQGRTWFMLRAKQLEE